jgi:hypothetical protein
MTVLKRKDFLKKIYRPMFKEILLKKSEKERKEIIRKRENKERERGKMEVWDRGIKSMREGKERNEGGKEKSERFIKRKSLKKYWLKERVKRLI